MRALRLMKKVSLTRKLTMRAKAKVSKVMKLVSPLSLTLASGIHLLNVTAHIDEADFGESLRLYLSKFWNLVDFVIVLVFWIWLFNDGSGEVQNRGGRIALSFCRLFLRGVAVARSVASRAARVREARAARAGHGD